MQFRMTYQGNLLSESRWNDPGKDRPLLAQNKHEIRKHFHKQIKKLWELHPALLKNESFYSRDAQTARKPGTVIFGTLGENHTARKLAEINSRFGYNFVPLLTASMNLVCELDILFLRPGKTGSIYNAGDIDNRLKSLLDALAMPQHQNQLGAFSTPELHERPFFCLLEDDALISKVSVEADTLLETQTGEPDEARVIITVRTKPVMITANNIGLS